MAVGTGCVGGASVGDDEIKGVAVGVPLVLVAVPSGAVGLPCAVPGTVDPGWLAVSTAIEALVPPMSSRPITASITRLLSMRLSPPRFPPGLANHSAL